MKLIHYIEEHQWVALVTGTAHIGFAHWLHTIEIPKIIMQLTQMGAWGVTIFVGCLTIYGFFKKKK